MDWLCAACKRAKATRQRNAKLCAACSWREARTQSSLPVEVPEALQADRCRLWEASAHDAPADPPSSEPDLLMLAELARAVGEDPAEVLQRVLSGSAKGSTRVYRSEWNRLMGQFVTRLEACWASAA